MREKAAAGAARGMFDVKHFVVKDVFDGDLGDAGMVHAAIQEDLIGAGVVAAELSAPASSAPADVGTAESAREIVVVELVEHFVEIEVAALRAGGGEANASAAHAADAAACAIG